jgi:hypothetical protein
MVESGIQRLFEELGCSDEQAQSPIVHSDLGCKGGLLADMRQLLEGNKHRDQHIEALHAAVNGLVNVVHEDVRQNTEARSSMGMHLEIVAKFLAYHQLSKPSNLL